jgi:signal transduction histidine kinase
VQELQRLTTALLEAVQDPVLVLDHAWRLRLFNPAAQHLFALSEGTVGKSLEEITQSEALTAFVQRGTPLPEWMPTSTNSAEAAAYEPRLQPIQSGDDSTQGWVLILRDLTPLKKLSRSQYEFVRILSHDLRSPLTSMKGFASMLESGTVGPVNEKQTYFVRKILSGIAQMSAQVDNIQDAGRFDPETGFYEMRREPVELGEIASNAVNDYLVPAEKQDLQISVSIADDLPVINADPLMLERAVTNLVDNAIKYTPNGGKIEVRVECRDQRVQVTVRDTGFGISPENQKLLFQRHVRIPREEHKKIKGTGLGLFIIRSVARQHGGDAWVESAEGQGSTFVLSIPLTGANLVLPQASD